MKHLNKNKILLISILVIALLIPSASFATSDIDINSKNDINFIIPEDIQQTIKKIYANDPKTPLANIAPLEMKNVVEYNAKEVDDVIEYISQNSIELKLPVESTVQQHSQMEEQDNYAVRYNSLTGEMTYETLAPVTSQEVQGSISKGPLMMPKAYPNDWTEPNPHTWDDTKTMSKLLITYPDGATAHATGFQVGRKYILTAGHALYLPAHGGMATQVISIPARRPSTESPTDPYGREWCYSFIVNSTYLNNQNQRYDYGLIQCTKYQGMMGLHGNYNDSNIWARVAGWPVSNWLLHLYGSPVQNNDSNFGSLVVNASNGMSGGPIQTFSDGYAYGIFLGLGGDGNALYLKFHNDFWQFIMNYRNQYQSTSD